MIDSHCHLDSRSFDRDRKEVMAQAVEQGVDRLINIGTDMDSSRRSLHLARDHENIFCTVGIHPHNARTLTDDFIGELRELAHFPRVVGIGEIGLDYYRDLSPRPVQRRAFLRQLDLAVELDLPVAIHVREAIDETTGIIADYSRKITGVFHCFPGTVEEAERIIDLGFHISVNGVMTYKNSKMADLGREIPLERILIETDCPCLPPVPYRGQRNCPAYVKLVCACLAQLRGISLKEADRVTTRNTEKLFRLVETFG